MTLNYTETVALIAAFKQEQKPTTFLKSRYFPDGRTFATDEVIVEYQDGNQKIAPFVVPEKDGKLVDRDKYVAEAYQPAYIAPKRALTIDTLKKKGFGEALYAELTPEQRALKITADDLVDMEKMIVRREEEMCSQVLQNNKLVMNHQTDDNSKPIVKHITFYTEGSNPAIYAPAELWTSADADIIADVAAMADQLGERGLPATDVILGAEAAAAFLNNEKILKLLDNRNYNIGAIDPTEGFNGATLLGVLNCNGHKMNFISYVAKYEAEDGTLTPYINPKDVIVTAPNCGVTNYGAITQIDFGAADFKTYEGKRVPLYSVKDQVKTVSLRTAPLVQPNAKSPFLKATVVGE